jgi:hypothetical protein
MAKKKKSKREKIGAYSKKFDAMQAAGRRKEKREIKANIAEGAKEIKGYKEYKYTEFPKKQYSPAEYAFIDDRTETYVKKGVEAENLQVRGTRWSAEKSQNAMKNFGLRLAKQAEDRAHASYKKQQKRND